ncbi:Ig-like domain repeat protein [Tundrisphaera sp. TA3]|uniref:Ig-like domain repeat protein n=1 Tax=Tundrisphaera sp. TA3 TaxID=3435775 RepID=UPI003EBCD255
MAASREDHRRRNRRRARRNVVLGEQLGPIEGLEQRMLMASKVWDGSFSANWTDGANWDDDTAPVAGDSLVFPSGASNLANTNDFAANTNFAGITIEGAGYSLAGNAINLTGDLFATNTTGTSTISAGLRLVTSRTASVAAGGTLNLSGQITSTDYSQDLTKTGLGTLRFSGSVNNQFDDVFANEGTVSLAMTNGSNLNSSDLIVGDNTSTATVVFEADRQLWAGANVSVNEGSTLDLGIYDADISNLYLQGATVQIDAGGLMKIFIGVFSTVTTNNVTSSITGGGSLGQSGSQFAFNVEDDADVDVDLSVGVAVTGSIAIEKDGTGTLELSGANTFVNALNINAGVLLATSDGSLGVFSTSSTYVDSGAALYFSGSNLTVSEQVYIAGTGIGGTGALRVVSGTTNLASGGNLAIYVLSAATIGADSGTTLNITGGLQTGFGSATPLTITNGATGRTILAANNNDFGGSLTLTEGYLRATQDNSFGSSSASSTVTIEDGGTLELSGGITMPDTKSFVLGGAPVAGSAKIVNLDGDNTLSGNITYTDEQTFAIADGTSLTLAGVISNGGTGDDLNFDGNSTGRAILSNANTYGGDTNVLGGYLRATNDSAFGDPGSSLNVTAASGASIELSGGVRIPDSKRFVLDGLPVAGSSKLISLAGYNQIDGDIALSSNNQSISVDSESFLFVNGGISGSVDLDKNGTGPLFLTGTSPFAGRFNVYDGPVYLNGSLGSAGQVFVDGILGGIGVASNIWVSGIGTLAPGDPEGNIGSLATTDLTFEPGSTFAVQLDGTDDYDQVVASGAINLAGSTLLVSLFSVPAIGDQYTIIVNDANALPVVGTFNGLAEGSILTLGAVTFAISYVGGDGNDVVLTAIDVVYTWDGGGESNSWAEGFNWVGDVAPTPGSRLVFPSGAARLSNVNDFGAGFEAYAIEINGAGYDISGGPIRVGQRIKATYTGSSMITAELTLGGEAGFGANVTDSATLILGGSVSGSVGFEKTGAGRLVAGGGFTFPVYQVLGGTLIVNGSASGGGNVSVDGTLGGSGSVRFVAVNAGGTLNPGDADAPATLISAGTSFNAEATFAVDLDGIGSYDKLLSFGGVDLNNATLAITLDAAPSPGDVYTIIDVFAGFGSVTGTFAGLAEGATLTLGNVVFTISYVGGDGNDVVLTSVAIVAQPATLVTPTAGSSYSQQVTASGGSGSGYVFTATGLPDGLSMGLGGLITGTPTTANASPVEVLITIVDSLGASATATYLVSVNAAIVASPAALPSPTAGSPYSQQVTASGGSGSGYTYSATGLPTGLSIDANGLITGTPTSTSPATVQVTITDGDGASVVKTYNLTADRAATSTGVSTSPGTTIFGEAVTLTATLTSDASGIGLPTGSVRFFSGETLLGTGTLDAQGVATFTTTALNAGSNAITAVYLGDSNFAASTSAPASQSVAKAASSTSLASSTTTPDLNQPVTLTATIVGPMGGSAGGTVSFFDGATLLGTAVVDGQGIATFVVAGLGMGAHEITASYGGDSNLLASSSPAVAVTITRSQTEAGSVTSSDPQVFFGETVVLTATFSATTTNGEPMTGTVSFFDGDTLLGTVDLAGLGSSNIRVAALSMPGTVSGQATLATTALGVGDHVIRAVYSGDVNYSSATSETPVSVRVDPTITSTTLTASTTPQGMILTAVVVVTSPGDPTVEGTVSFFDGTTLLGTVPIVGGSASLNIGTPPPGTHAYSAIFVGGANSSAGDSMGTLTPASATSGVVFLDINANGVQDAGEPGLAGRVVFIDQNGDRTLNPGEPTATTSSDGSFAFPGIAQGSAPVVEATGLDTSLRYVVDQTRTLSDGSVTLGVVPFSPIAAVPVVPNPFVASPPADANAAFVQSLYRAVLGREGDGWEVQTWLDRIAGGMDRAGVTQGFVNSVEHRQQQVEGFYQSFLGRSTDPGSVFWVNALLAGASEESVAEAILNSDEYQSNHQDPALLVRDLYLDVLGREGEGSSVAVYQAQLASGASRASIVTQFVQSLEAVDQILDGFYSSYLRRGRDSFSGRWVDELDSPTGSATSVAVGILASDEFFASSTRGGR